MCRARAPLRISFGGGGTELPSYAREHGGVVLNATIGRRVYASLSAADKVEFVSVDHMTSESFATDAVAKPASGLLQLHHAVYTHMMRNCNAGVPMPLRLSTFSDVTAGSGLGSSSSMTVAIVKCFDEAMGLGLDSYGLAELARRIEREELGLSGGSQDHYAAAFGGINFIDFNKDDSVAVAPVELDLEVRAELEHSIVLYFTGVSRQSAKIIEAQMSKIDSHDDRALEGLKTIKKLALEMRMCLRRGDIKELARLLHESWEAKRSTADGVSTAMIDEIYANARAAGALGGKISGAGGGGFMLLLCDPARRGEVLAALPDSDSQNCYCTLSDDGAVAWWLR